VSCNDPHLEAQMELEARSTRRPESPPPGFARKQAWVLAAVLVALMMIVFRALSEPLFWMALAALPAIGVALILNRRDPKPPENPSRDDI
jgi:hypothetical protein